MMRIQIKAKGGTTASGNGHPLPDAVAMALAQFCKRSTLSDFTRCATSDAEAEGIGVVRAVLADAGLDPC